MKKDIKNIEVNQPTIIRPQHKSPYRTPQYKKTTLLVNNSYIGERIEDKVRRISTNNEPITDTAPIIYTERKNGTQPEYNIRTDRFELAVEAMDKYEKSITAERKSWDMPKESPENTGDTTE